MREPSTFVGMDVHKKDIAVAMLVEGTGGPLEWRAANEPTAVRRLARKLQQEGRGTVPCVYEAGPCGYALQRQLQGLGVGGEGAHPSLIPISPGQSIQPRPRDARQLAQFAR